jgi:intracellular sulfur oxidation DsrE/DsrF family protein
VNELSRRALLSGAAVTAASVMWKEPLHAQLVWKKSNWHIEEFSKLLNSSRRIKQIIHTDAINGGRFLRNAKNGLNGLRFGHGVAVDQVQIVCGLNGQANVLNYSDYVWEKYRVGEWVKVNDPKTGKPALRNIFYPSKSGTPGYDSEDPSNEDSMYQDASVQALQSRGVQFVSCHTSTEEAARALIQQNSLGAHPEEVAQDMVEHVLPGVIIVPSLAAALAVLQCEGHFSYMAA